MFGVADRQFIGCSFMLVFNLTLPCPPARPSVASVVSVAYCNLEYSIFRFASYLPPLVDRPRLCTRTRCRNMSLWKLPETSDKLSVCMFYRFRQVQTELSDLEPGGELNRPTKSMLNRCSAAIQRPRIDDGCFSFALRTVIPRNLTTFLRR